MRIPHRSVLAAIALVVVSVVALPAGAAVVPTDGDVAPTRSARQQTADFAVRSFVAPSRVEPGEAVRIEATIANTGDAPGTTEVEYRIDGESLASRTVSIDPGSTASVTFRVVIPDLAPGDHTQGVFVAATGAGQTATLKVAVSRPSFSVVDMQAPSRADPGERITVDATVLNSGDASGTRILAYRFDGRTLATQTVSLDAGSSVSVSFRITLPGVDPGTYSHGVFIDGTDSSQSRSIRIEGLPSFRISDLQAPSNADPDERITVRARLTNTGSARGSTRLEYRLGGRSLITERVTLDAGESVTVTLQPRVPDLEAGRYTHGVFLEGTDIGQTARLTITGVPEFGVSDLRAPAGATVGDRITVRATVRNTGNARGSTRLEYRFDGDVLARESVRLDPGARETVRFEVEVPDVKGGTYRHGVFVGGTNRGQTSSIAVRAGEPAFTVSDLRAPADAAPGGQIRVRATVTNTGDAAGRTDLEYRFDGRTLATRTVSVAAGERRTVTFTVDLPDAAPGTYRHGVFLEGTDRGQTSSIAVRRGGSPAFNVFDLRAPAKATPGDEITVRATIVNTGAAPGSTPVEYRLDGETLASRTVDLDRGARTTVTFRVNVPDLAAGTYRHGVFVGGTDRGQTSSLVIRVPAEPGETRTEAPGQPGFTFVMAVAALALGALFALRRRR